MVDTLAASEQPDSQGKEESQCSDSHYTDLKQNAEERHLYPDFEDRDSS